MGLAIQGLNKKLGEREALLREELRRRDIENAGLKRELAALKDLVLQLAAKAESRTGR